MRHTRPISDSNKTKIDDILAACQSSLTSCRTNKRKVGRMNTAVNVGYSLTGAAGLWESASAYNEQEPSPYSKLFIVIMWIAIFAIKFLYYQLSLDVAITEQQQLIEDWYRTACMATDVLTHRFIDHEHETMCVTAVVTTFRNATIKTQDFHRWYYGTSEFLSAIQ